MKTREIAAEFGEPFPLVVKGFAAMGYSKQATGRALGYKTAGGFHCVLTSWGLHEHFLPRGKQRPECRGKGTPRPRKYTDESLLRAVASVSSCKRFANETGIALSTVLYRFGSWSEAKKLARGGQYHE